MRDHSLESWTIIGGGHAIHVLCPRYFVAILKQILNGWTIQPSDQTCVHEISVRFDNENYTVDSIVLTTPVRHTDIMNAVNEVLINFAYVITALNQNTLLLHCAGYCEGCLLNVVIGQKNRGKSSLMYQKALGGQTIVADDLLLWHPKVGRFTALGLPLRLRRPVLDFNGTTANPAHFFAGNNIAYSKVNAFKMAKIGETFLLDTLWELDDDYSPKKVSILRAPSALKRFVIGDDFTTIVKTKVE